MNTIAGKLAEHTRRHILAKHLSGANIGKLARIQTYPLFEVAMYGKEAVTKRRATRVSNLPLKKAA